MSIPTDHPVCLNFLEYMNYVWRCLTHAVIVMHKFCASFTLPTMWNNHETFLSDGTKCMLAQFLINVLQTQPRGGVKLKMRKTLWKIPNYRVYQKKWANLFSLYLSNQISDFQIVFFSWKLRSIRKFWIQHHFCAIFTKQNVVLK